jgi:hypothetical protein
MEVIDESLDYSVKNYNHSTLHMRNIAPQSSADITLSGASVSGPTQFVVSSSVFNPAKSRLTFNVAGTLTTASKTAFLQGNTLSLINRIVCYDMNTSAIMADINNVGEIYNMLTPATTVAEELRHKSGGVSIGNAATQAAANTLADLKPQEDIKKCAATNVNGANTDIAGDNDFFQVQQLIPAAAGGSVAYGARVSIPFSAFKHSFFAIDKMVYNPSNIAIDVYWEGYNKSVFEGDAAATPATNVAVVASSVVSKAQINLCTEGNVNVASQVIQKVMSSGLSLPIGYISGIRQVGAGTSQSLTLPLTAAYGKKILYVATAFFDPAATANLSKIHSKYAGGGATNDLSTYNTFINGVPILAPAGFNGLTSEDYLIANKQYLEGSCIQTINDYAYQWLHIDNFARTKLCELDTAHVDGLDVLSQQANWQIQYTFATGAAYQHYIAVVGQKTLSITSQGALVS